MHAQLYGNDAQFDGVHGRRHLQVWKAPDSLRRVEEGWQWPSQFGERRKANGENSEYKKNGEHGENGKNPRTADGEQQRTKNTRQQRRTTDSKRRFGLSFSLCLCQRVCQSVRQSVSLSVCPSVCLSVGLFLSLSVSVCLSLSVFVCLCLSVGRSVGRVKRGACVRACLRPTLSFPLPPFLQNAAGSMDDAWMDEERDEHNKH